jgi:hypothetical protein
MKSDLAWMENILLSYCILLLTKHRNQIEEVLKSNETKICKETKPQGFPRPYEDGKHFEVH